ncbi:unnamed protein product [Heterobilharzia americana]|nr:unnamed protein product [Heterobilharzia americana]
MFRHSNHHWEAALTLADELSMEISSIDSKKFRIGDLKKKFGSWLPKEYRVLKEKEADSVAKSELQKLVADSSIFEQLRRIAV